MSTALDPGKSFVQIETWYVEETGLHGNTLFYFVNEKNYTNWPIEKMKKLTTVWRQMSWKDHNSFLSRSSRRSGVNYYHYRDLKLKHCLKNWDAIDDNGNSIPYSPEIIDQLYPVIANYLLDAYENECEMSSKDLESLRRKARLFFDGKPTQEIPQYIYEHVLAYHYGWTTDEIRNMDYRDVLAHVQLCLTSDGLDKEFEIRLTGVDPSKPKRVSAEKVLQGGEPTIRQY